MISLTRPQRGNCALKIDIDLGEQIMAAVTDCFSKGGILTLLTLLNACKVHAQTNVSLTGSVANNVFRIGVVNTSVTWYQAADSCGLLGYDGWLDSRPSNAKLQAVTEFLRTNGHPSPATFWVGFFRPYPQITSWYRSSSCRKILGITSRIKSSMDDKQCAVLHYGSTIEYDSPTFLGKPCNQQYPFMCDTNVQRKEKLYYEGYSAGVPLTEFTSLILNVSLSYCNETFNNTSHSPLYTYNHTNHTCEIWSLSDGYGSGQVNLTYTGDNTTLVGVRNGTYTIQYHQLNLNETPVLVDPSLPECNISPIPDNYCPCGIPEEEFDQIIQDMTVDSTTTAKAKQKLHSAADDRASSKIVGSVGVVIVVLVVGMIVAFDLTTLLAKRGEIWAGLRDKMKKTTVNE